ncbi:MAG: hypothetical protein F4X11_10555 [Acidobacteria bacterium]|nr:hypothetical protein [Acidobacteriota bacterium]
MRTILTAVALHGVFTVGLPALILQRAQRIPQLAADVGQLRWLGAALAVFGIYLYVWSAACLKEEPDLRRVFGAQFDAYCRKVPRWIPRLRRSTRRT